MDWLVDNNNIFLRVDPGEYLIESLRSMADSLGLTTVAITSGVGMLKTIELGFFDTHQDDYTSTHREGIFDVNSILGNVTRRDGIPVPHVHIVFNDTSHATYSGHVIEAQCHITMEIFLSTSHPTLRRVKQAGRPATQIVWE